MSGFHLYTGNRLEDLVDALAENLRSPLSPPLQTEVIVVQSKGMERWISMELATRNGICANTSFPFPRHFIKRLFEDVAPQPDLELFTTEAMTWKIMKEIPGLLTTAGCESLAGYLAGDEQDVKLFQLSLKIASVFDQYLVFRPDIILEWDAGRNSIAADSPHARWQALLWRRVAGGNKDCHPAALKKALLDRIARGECLEGLPRRLSIFGVTTLPPYYFEIVTALSALIDVHFYYLNPCRGFWEYVYSEKEIARFADRSADGTDQYFDCGNSLLASMGACGRQFFSLVMQCVGETGRDLFHDNGADTMLGRVQSDILNMTNTGDDPVEASAVTAGDRSIQIHSCHSPLREVEVLYDNLLYLFEADSGLLPRDVVVMMPDVGEYAPLIQAVFESPEDESVRIPYSIADCSARKSNLLAETFFAILKLDQQRFGSAAVLDILENEAVRTRFQLQPEDLDAVRQWVRDSGICWGLDGAYRDGLGLPSFHENSWAFGLERMLLGYALPHSDDGKVFGGMVPYGDMEGDNARILDSFLKFTRMLFTSVVGLRPGRSLAQWADALTCILHDFFACDDRWLPDMKEISDMLADGGLRGFESLSGFHDAVSLDVVCAWLSTIFEQQSCGHGYLSTGVTFCTMLPMRSIPFKVVYIMGMNDGDYPRKSQRHGFDLIDHQPRLCDRSKRLEDRYLFLEALLSARQHLIISYQGRSMKDNSDMPPSTLVCELRDYLEQAFWAADGGDILERVITQHPMHPFSREYFIPKNQLFSYSKENCEAAGKALQGAAEMPPFVDGPLPAPTGDELSVLNVDQVIRFFVNPCEFFMRYRLNIDLRLDDRGRAEEREPFELDALQQYMLRQDMTKACMQGQGLDDYYDVVKHAGVLPHGNPGKAVYQAQVDEVCRFVDTVRSAMRAEPRDPMQVQLAFERPRMVLNAVIGNTYASGQLFYRCAAIKSRDYLQAWLYHLVLNCVQNYEGCRRTMLVGQDAEICFAEIQAPRARAILVTLLGLFADGVCAPLCFFSKTSFAYAETLIRKAKSDNDALTAARKVWYPGYMQAGESEDPYIAACYGNTLPEGSELRSTAVAVFEPLMNSIDEGDIA